MRAGYHLGGLLLHDPIVAIEELAHLGFQCVAVRPHAAWFHPDLPHFSSQVLRLRDVLRRTGMTAVFDLDASFMDNPFDRRGATLLDDQNERSERAVESIWQWSAIANEIGVPIMTVSSGPAETGTSPLSLTPLREESYERLAKQVESLLTGMNERVGDSVRLAIRPKHGDCIDSVARFEQWLQWTGQSTDETLGLAADVGEMLSAVEIPIADRIERHVDRLACVYLCDRRPGSSSARGMTTAADASPRDHRIGHGDVAVDRIIDSLRRFGYQGPAIVRVEGHGEFGLLPAQESIGLFEI